MMLRVVLIETRDVLADTVVRGVAREMPGIELLSFGRLADALDMPPTDERLLICIGLRLLDEPLVAMLQCLAARHPRATLLMIRGAADFLALRGLMEALAESGADQPAPGWHPASAQQPLRPAPPRLSEREMQIVLLLREGLQNKLIARRLDLSVSTVKTHVANIFRKIGAGNRLDAICKFAALSPAPKSDPLLSFRQHMLATRGAMLTSPAA